MRTEITVRVLVILPSWLFSNLGNLNLLAGETVDNTFVAVVYFCRIFLSKNSYLDHLSRDRLTCLKFKAIYGKFPPSTFFEKKKENINKK